MPGLAIPGFRSHCPAAAACAAISRRSNSPITSESVPFCTLALIAGQQQPGQGDVIELVQVAQFVINRQSVLTGPVQGFAQAPGPARGVSCALPPDAHSGKSFPSYRRSAWSSRSRAPSRSPWICRRRAIAARQRYGFCGNSPAHPAPGW